MNNGVFIKINGETFIEIYSFSLYRSINTLLSTCEFEVRMSKDERRSGNFGSYLSCGDLFSAYIDSQEKNSIIFTGFIEFIDVDAEDNMVKTICKGRDKTQDFHDSTLIPKRYDPANGLRSFIINGKLDLIQVTKTILTSLGYTITASPSRIYDPYQLNVLSKIDSINADIKGVSLTENDIILTNPGKIQASIEQKAFEFVRFYANQVGVFINTTPEGDIMFSRPSNETQEPVAKLINRFVEIPEEPNNVKKVRYMLNDGQRFHKYYCMGHLQQSAESKNDLFMISGEPVIDEEIRKTRHMAYISNDDLSNELVSKKSTLFAMTQKARSRQMIIKIPGFTYGGFVSDKSGVWNVNDLVYVVDDDSGTDTILLITDIKYVQENKMTYTEMTLVDPDYYAQISLRLRKHKHFLKNVTKVKLN